MEILRRVRVVERFFEQCDAVLEQGVAQYDETASVACFILADKLLAFVSRRMMRLVEGSSGRRRSQRLQGSIRRSRIRVRDDEKTIGLPSRAFLPSSRAHLARSIRFFQSGSQPGTGDRAGASPSFAGTLFAGSRGLGGGMALVDTTNMMVLVVDALFACQDDLRDQSYQRLLA